MKPKSATRQGEIPQEPMTISAAMLAVAAAEEEEELVAEEPCGRGDGGDRGERQVAVLRSEARQEDDGLAFEQGADEQDDVT